MNFDDAEEMKQLHKELNAQLTNYPPNVKPIICGTITIVKTNDETGEIEFIVVKKDGIKFAIISNGKLEIVPYQDGGGRASTLF
jgi:hypothetical protein